MLKYDMSSHPITQKQRNAMLAVPGFRGKMLTKNLPNGTQKFFFIGSNEEHLDLLNRCKYL
jgi:hypothetical protein